VGESPLCKQVTSNSPRGAHSHPRDEGKRTHIDLE